MAGPGKVSKLKAEFEEFAKADKRKHGPKCRVCALPKEYLDMVHQAKADGIEITVVERFLRKKGLSIPDFTISRHFRQDHDEAK